MVSMSWRTCSFNMLESSIERIFCRKIAQSILLIIVKALKWKKEDICMSSFKLNLNESTTITIKLKLSYQPNVAATICFNEKRLFFSERIVLTYKRKKWKGNWKEKDLKCYDLEWFQLQAAITGIKKRKLSTNFLLITQPE